MASSEGLQPDDWKILDGVVEDPEDFAYDLVQAGWVPPSVLVNLKAKFLLESLNDAIYDDWDEDPE